MTAPRSSEGPGLYLHLPFCSEVCPYCDFAVVKASEARRRRFASAITREIERVGPLERAGFDTVYFGGGTPSLLPAEDLAALLEACRRHLGVLPDSWVFLEANPEDVTAESLEAWRRLGVRTLSLGVQSFDDAELAFLGRRHSGRGAEEAVHRAKAAGFSTVSLDLIFGLPGQDQAALRRSLERALALEPDHLSAYQLTVHEGTAFGTRRRKGQLAELGEDGQADLFGLLHRVLADHGLAAYEVSNFARGPEHRSRHNQKYWRHAPYLGLGPSAHSFDGRRRRSWNERRLDGWLRRLDLGQRPLAGWEDLEPEALALEAVMLGLRTTEGIDLASFTERYGFDLAAANAARLERWREQGLVRLEDGRLAATLAGLAVADGLVAALELEPALPGTTMAPC
ncbi:MAG TPA: radical SAM family heme chaperone HemW [Thermoanaerobaculia bacterium]|nr:radical SAM family heme chaperone HemW [Thermoanaerobaculia bacterium]